MDGGPTAMDRPWLHAQIVPQGRGRRDQGVIRMDAPELGQGSRLASSSKHLDHAGMRDWSAREMLRRNGGDLPPPAGVYEMSEILAELRDPDRLEALISAERARHPGFDAWFRQGREINLTREKLAKC